MVKIRTLNALQMEHHHLVKWLMRFVSTYLTTLKVPSSPRKGFCMGVSLSLLTQFCRNPTKMLHEAPYHWPCTLSRCRLAALWLPHIAGPACCAGASSSGLPLPRRRQDPCCPPSWSSQPPWCCSCSSLQGDNDALRNFGSSAGSVRPWNKEQKNWWIREQKNEWVVNLSTVRSEQPESIRGERRGIHVHKSMWFCQGSFLL